MTILAQGHMDKTGPTAIWSTTSLQVFDKNISATQNVILSQGRFALLSMLGRIVNLYQCLAVQPNIIDSYLHPEIPQIINEICLHQGIASSILFNGSSQSQNENKYMYNLRMERFEYVKNFCSLSSIETPTLSNRQLRNQLVHIDEYLVKAMREPNTGWVIDSAHAYRDQFSAPNGLKIGFCRCFIASEEIILHLKSEISIPSLWEEASATLAAVFGIPQKPAPQAPPHSRRK